MSRLSLVLCMLVAVAGCKDKWDKALAETEAFKDRMCACKDQACVDAVNKDVDEWTEALKAKIKEDKPPDKVMEEGRKIKKEMRECEGRVEKAAGAGAMDAAMKKMIEFKNQMCACNDSKCAQKVADDMTKWGQENAKTPPGLLDEAAEKQMTDVSKQFADCMTKAMTPATP
jgi:hypothetical protein